MKCKISQKEVKGVTNKGLLIKGVSQTIEMKQENKELKSFFILLFLFFYSGSIV